MTGDVSAFGQQSSDYSTHLPTNASTSSPVTRQALHPAYFQTHFRVDGPMPAWPAEFIIISACATTGQSWSVERTRQADQRLEAELRSLDCWVERIVGYSPTTGHAEPSWAAGISLALGCIIGKKYLQDAIYHVADDMLFVTQCNTELTPVHIGQFSDRVHLADTARE